ncbi:hypothetical protein Syun_001847 [Stephania yunnanensis]|uniref:Uncharacterized protein n=1 Tax=Stephania yunnanensis TaxID=152371 RepID=A0AAP0LEG2_9MAGN
MTEDGGPSTDLLKNNPPDILDENHATKKEKNKDPISLTMADPSSFRNILVRSEPSEESIENIDYDIEEYKIEEAETRCSICNYDIPSIEFTYDSNTQLLDAMKYAVIVKLFGRRQGLWKPTGSFRMLDMENDHYLMKMSNSKDYLKALTGALRSAAEQGQEADTQRSTMRISERPSSAHFCRRFQFLPLRILEEMGLEKRCKTMLPLCKLGTHDGDGGLVISWIEVYMK